jgi:hypothetical protein
VGKRRRVEGGRSGKGEGMDGKWEGLKVVKGVKLRVGKRGKGLRMGKGEVTGGGKRGRLKGGEKGKGSGW